VLVEPLAKLLGWHIGETEAVETLLGDEEGSQPLLIPDSTRPIGRLLAVPGEASLDHAPEGLHRRYAPIRSLIRILEREGLTWGILLNAFTLRVVRRSEGFVASHLEFDLDAIGRDLAGSREAFHLLWGLLRQDSWMAAPALLDEVVRLGREHQVEVGSLLGQQVPSAVERLLQGALSHPANQRELAPFLTGPVARRELLEHLHAGALRCLYRILFVLYAEARGLLPLDMPSYRDGYALTGSRGLIHKALNRATDPRENRLAANGYFEASLRALFALLRAGADLGPEGRIPAYGGGLFHPQPSVEGERPAFDDLQIGDDAVAHVLQALTRVSTRNGLVTLSYRELDVEQLGSLYEGLLDRSVDYLEEPVWRIRLDGDIVLVTDEQMADLRKRRGETRGEFSDDAESEEDEDVEESAAEPEEEAEEEPVATDKKKPIKRLDLQPIPAGSVVLRPGLGRKQSGSYYTNRAFVEYLVRRAVDPLAEGKTPGQILKLAVCDPAMGSGHFLVGACRRLSEHLLTAYKARYSEEQELAAREGREVYPHELLIDAGVHAEVARHWGDEPAELTACRQLVAAHCIYGVDLNPLSVELARVSLWLATAASDHPLTFLDHRLVPGNSLLGIKVDDLLRAFSGKKVTRQLTGDPSEQSLLELYFGRDELNLRIERAFSFLEQIERLESEQPGDFEDQQVAYFAMRQELQDFLDAHNLRIGRAFLNANDPAADRLLANEWMREIEQRQHVMGETRDKAAPAIAKGKELGAFCWELTFPELFFSLDRRGRPGFDAMVGNPPWDKIEPKRKEFFSQFDPAIRDFQGQTLTRRIAQLAPPESDAQIRWQHYDARESSLAKLLIGGGVYQFQVVEVNGEKTGGKPDLFKLFVERFHQLIRPGGRAGILMPAGLYALEGATGVRRMLFGHARVEAMYSFENAFERFFPGVDSRTKFLVLTFGKQEADNQSFPAAFMLRDESFLALPDAARDARSVRITSDFIRLTNPAYLSLVELRDDNEREFVERIYREVPPLSKKLEGEGAWNTEFHRELNMTDDAWRFRRRDWLLERGCIQEGSSFVAPSKDWYLLRADEFVSGKRYIVPEGTKYRITSEKPSEEREKRGRRGVTVQGVSGFLVASREDDELEMPVVPDARYIPLYEGRMVHQFDHAAKAYVSGEGRGAKWRDLDFSEKLLVPHFYVDGTDMASQARAGFCDVTGQTNERSALATLLPGGMPAGNSVPTVTTDNEDCHLVWLAFANSLVGDFLIRQKISTHLNLFYVESWPLLRPRTHSAQFQELKTRSARLVSFTNEIQIAEPVLDERKRAFIRAEIDAIVAGLYQLSPAEFAKILTTFPLLDRDQPPLPGDFFVRWNKQGRPKEEPRSYVTRDTALLGYFRHLNHAPPVDLATWYRDEVGVNMIDDPTCPYRMGPICSLEARVTEHQRRGAIAYLPSKAKKWDPNGRYQPPDLPTDWQAWIIQNRDIRGGALTLKGTRLSVDEVKRQLVAKTFEEIRNSFPQLTDAHIAVALATGTGGA
jgi:uncharacterized protein (DUF433 family)